MAVEKKPKLTEDEEKEIQEEQKEKPKKKIKILPIVIALVALVAVAVGAYFISPVLFSGKSAESEKATETKATEGVNFSLEPFVVNLMDQGGTRYLKVSVQLELSNPKVSENAKNKTPQIRDAIITLLTNKTSEELITPEGKLLLKDEIKQRANQILGEGNVINVYLTDFVMQ